MLSCYLTAKPGAIGHPATFDYFWCSWIIKSSPIQGVGWGWDLGSTKNSQVLPKPILTSHTATCRNRKVTNCWHKELDRPERGTSASFWRPTRGFSVRTRLIHAWLTGQEAHKTTVYNKCSLFYRECLSLVDAAQILQMYQGVCRFTVQIQKGWILQPQRLLIFVFALFVMCDPHFKVSITICNKSLWWILSL